MDLNAPLWHPDNQKTNSGFQEAWYLRLNDPAQQRAFWLRFEILVSTNGFRQVADAWAVFFEKTPSKEISKTALQQSFDLSSFQNLTEGGNCHFKMGDSEFGERFTRGKLQSKGKTISWDLQFVPRQTTSFRAISENLKWPGLVKTFSSTPDEDLLFSGTIQVNGTSYTLQGAPGMQGHESKPHYGQGWVWAQANAFVDEKNEVAPFVFEGLTIVPRVFGTLPGPKLSTYYFLYRGQEYHFNSFWDAIRLRSKHSITGWQFQADRQDLSFRGTARAEHRDFAGLTLEDTDGSLIYLAASRLSTLEVHVYRRGKLESTLRATGTASFEVASRRKNPYVPLLV